MKKLVIMLAAAAIAACSQAASYTWACESGRINDGTGVTSYATMEGKTAYLMFASIYSQSDALAAYAAGSFDTSKAVGVSTINDAGRILTSDATADVTADDTAYFVVLNGDQMYISSTAVAEYWAVGASGITFESQSTPSKSVVGLASDGYSTAGWYSASSGTGGGGIPEPTSGLLLLIGGSLLALRRKQK